MTTAYTSLLGLALPVTGELSGTWGDTVNNSITSLLDSAIAGTTTITSDADVTLTTTTGSANTSRQAIILWTAGGTATRTIIAPAQSKIYTVINASSSTQSIILAGAGPTSGVTIAKGESALCAWNGSDFIKISNTAGPGTFTNLTVTGNTTLGDAVTDTITVNSQFVTGTVLRSAQANTNTLSLAAYDVDGTAYTNLITLTAGNTPTLALTSTGVGTINNMSIGATTASTGAFTTLSATGVTTVQAGTAAAPAITTTGDTNTGIFFPAADTIAFTEGGVESMRIDASGNLGLGVTPNANWATLVGLQVSTTAVLSGQPSAEVMRLGSNWYFGGGFKYLSAATATRYDQNDGKHSWYNAPSGTANAAITFTQAMTLDASGRLGIGITSPGANQGMLQVAGSSQSWFKFYDSTAGYNFGTFYKANGTTALAYLGGGTSAIAGGTVDDFVIRAEGNLLFATGGGTEKMRLDASGNLGLGVTPSAWGSRKALEVGNAGSAFFSAGVNQNYLTSNSYFDGAFKYGATGTATAYQQYAGTHAWLNAASGSAGGVITFTQAMTLDASGRLGVGTTSPSNIAVFNTAALTNTFDGATVSYNNTASSVGLYQTGTTYSYGAAGASESWLYSSTRNLVVMADGVSSVIKFATGGNTERARIDSSGNLLVGTTTAGAGAGFPTKLVIDAGSGDSSIFKCSSAINAIPLRAWNSDTTGDNYFINFATETSYTSRGSITYNRTGGLIVYGTSSDYRAKDITGPVTDSGALIDSVPVYMGKMKWAEQERPMFIAHETPTYAHTGEKDAVDVDGKPVYQQMDASALIPVMWAEIQDLRKRLAAAGI